MTTTTNKLRLLLPAALLVTAAVVGGLAAVLVSFVAVLLLLDQALGRVLDGFSAAGARERYLQVARARRRAAVAARLRGRRASALAVLPTDAGWVAVAQRRRVGVQTIALASIVGTVEAQKAAAFDAEFRPPAWSRGRWTLLCLAVQRGTALPPIAVYRADGYHYVRDGHHRVSVARALGATEIDADVVELSRAATSTAA
jgi:hypothetical protein